MEGKWAPAKHIHAAKMSAGAWCGAQPSSDQHAGDALVCPKLQLQQGGSHFMMMQTMHLPCQLLPLLLNSCDQSVLAWRPAPATRTCMTYSPRPWSCATSTATAAGPKQKYSMAGRLVSIWPSSAEWKWMLHSCCRPAWPCRPMPSWPRRRLAAPSAASKYWHLAWVWTPASPPSDQLETRLAA